MEEVKKKKDQNQTSRDEKYNAWKEKYTGLGLMADDTLQKKRLMYLKYDNRN